MSEENGKPSEAGNEETVDVKELASTVKGLAEAVGGMHGNIKTLTESLQSMQKGDDEDDPDDSPVDVNLETLSRTEFAAHLMDQVGKVVKDAVKPVQERAEEVDSRVTSGSVKAMIQELRDGAHPDIDEWGEELRDVLKESPGLSLKRAIKIAKDENPEKAAKLKNEFDEKRDEAERKAEEARRKKRKNFGGLTPGSSKTEKTRRMSQEDAAAAAWDEVVTGLDDPSLLNDTS